MFLHHIDFIRIKTFCCREQGSYNIFFAAGSEETKARVTVWGGRPEQVEEGMSICLYNVTTRDSWGGRVQLTGCRGAMMFIDRQRQVEVWPSEIMRWDLSIVTNMSFCHTLRNDFFSLFAVFCYS